MCLLGRDEGSAYEGWAAVHQAWGRRVACDETVTAGPRGRRVACGEPRRGESKTNIYICIYICSVRFTSIIIISLIIIIVNPPRGTVVRSPARAVSIPGAHCFRCRQPARWGMLFFMHAAGELVTSSGRRFVFYVIVTCRSNGRGMDSFGLHLFYLPLGIRLCPL